MCTFVANAEYTEERARVSESCARERAVKRQTFTSRMLDNTAITDAMAA